MTRPALEIRDVRGNRLGTYYTLNETTKGAIGVTATVTVKHTKYNTYACLTCLVVTCRHAQFVERGVNDGTILEKAS